MTKPLVVTATTIADGTEMTVSSAKAASSPAVYSFTSRYLSPFCVMSTCARLARVRPLKTRVALRGLSSAPSRMLSVTETVTSMTPVPESGVTVTQSGTSVTQSASA